MRSELSGDSSPRDKYAWWLRTSEGQAEARERSQLWQIYRQQLSWGCSAQTEEHLRHCYIQKRRAWESRQTGSASQYLPSPRWDTIWPKAARFCDRYGVSPTVLVGALFDQQHDRRRIQPNSLLADDVQSRALRISRGDQALTREDVDLLRMRCVSAFEELRRAVSWLRFFSVRALSNQELLNFAIVNQRGTVYELPAYCVAATEGVWPACCELRQGAFQQWQSAPREYCLVLGELCPPEWQVVEPESL